VKMVRHLTCPHCAQPAFSCWKKLGMGPFQHVPCPACGKPVRVARLLGVTTYILLEFTALLSLLLPYLLFGAIRFSWVLPVLFASFILIHVPLAWVYCRLVPLVAHPGRHM